MHSFADNNGVTVENKNGEKTTFLFSQKPEITMTMSDIVITMGATEIHYPIASVKRFTLTDATGIETPTVHNNPGDVTFVYTANGELVGRYSAEYFTSEQLSNGIYIIKTNKSTYKLIKK